MKRIENLRLRSGAGVQQAEVLWEEEVQQACWEDLLEEVLTAEEAEVLEVDYPTGIG